MKAIYIFNRDLRLEDNEAIIEASKASSLCCAIAIKETEAWGIPKKNFYYESINNLAKNLKDLGHDLFVVTKEDIDKLQKFDQVIITKNYNSRELPWLKELSNKITEIDQSTLFKIDELPFTIEKLKKTFTPFRHQMDKVKKMPERIEAPTSLPELFSVGLERYEVLDIDESHSEFLGGEEEALKRLTYYFSKKELALNYFETRNGMVDFDDSTKFSPWLAWGCLSAKRIYFELKNFEEKFGSNKSTYWIFFELLWRDYFKFLSLQKGNSIFDIKGTSGRVLSFHPKQDSLFEQWKKAQTEESFVNANMNELNQTGWMSNRGRQNVASFLAKTYQVNWLWGAEYFEKHLLDADIESNFGNWGYLAGVGVDPRDRKFNIQRQQEMYDPDLEYTNKFTA